MKLIAKAGYWGKECFVLFGIRITFFLYLKNKIKKFKDYRNSVNSLFVLANEAGNLCDNNCDDCPHLSGIKDEEGGEYCCYWDENLECDYEASDCDCDGRPARKGSVDLVAIHKCFPCEYSDNFQDLPWNEKEKACREFAKHYAKGEKWFSDYDRTTKKSTGYWAKRRRINTQINKKLFYNGGQK